MGVVVCCAIGGTLEPQEGVTAIGIQSRSLVAAYQLVKAGYTGIRVLKNGMGAWVQDGREVYTYEEEEEYELPSLGRRWSLQRGRSLGARQALHEVEPDRPSAA